MASNDEDRRDIAACLEGDQEAFGRLVTRFQKVVYYLALRKLGNSEEADDITQKTFLKAYRALAGFEFRSSFKTWLMTIAINLCRSELSKRKRREVELPPSQADPEFSESEEAEEQDFRRTQLENALQRLPPRQKEVVLLRIQQELSFKEIGKRLNSNETAVKVNFHYAMKSLRQWIQRRIKRDEKL